LSPELEKRDDVAALRAKLKQASPPSARVGATL